MLDAILALVDFIRHIDRHLAELTREYGAWTYGILFGIVFLETGVVVTPFLPGDSLLFAAGAIASLGELDVWLLGALLIVAAILGDTANYHLGKYLGPRVLRGEKSWLFDRRHLDRTNAFFEKYGAKTIILARFVPIVRTFAPFVAGVGAMRYGRFLAYNVVGAVVWVAIFLTAGYLFGQHPAVKRNFSLVILGIIVVSVLPMAWEAWQAWRKRTVVSDS
ncbi:MAG: DedA family protein [Planctomycetota bacterium]